MSEPKKVLVNQYCFWKNQYNLARGRVFEAKNGKSGGHRLADADSFCATGKPMNVRESSISIWITLYA